MPTLEEIHLTVNLNNYFWFEDVHYNKTYNLYYLDLTSKATGEIIEIPLEEEHFNKLLKELELEVTRKECLSEHLPIIRRYLER